MAMQEPSVTHLLEIIDQQNKIIASLQMEIVILKARISELERKKNSGNSNLPPSSDMGSPKRNESLREKSGRKSGGQAGHEGSTLKMSSTPDKIEYHTPSKCEGCGHDLSLINAELEECRQVVDVPPIMPTTTEHRTFSKRCACGCVSVGKFPDNVNGNVQYGTNLTARIAYLNVRQYMPYNRIKEFLFHFAGLSISEGSIYNMLQEFARKCTPQYESIKMDIENSSNAGTDETGAKVNGKKYWFWAWQNKASTYIVASSSRGFQTIQNTFPQGLPKVILSHDRWAAHFQCKAKNHQICIAHLQRELNYIGELYQHKWSTSFKECLSDALKLQNKLLILNDFDSLKEQKRKIEKRLDELLKAKLPEKLSKAKTLQKKLSSIRNHILVFLYYKDVPADNNASERAIRNIKVKEKVSGQFRTFEGAQAFAVIRSVIDTTIKRGTSCFDALFAIANLEAE